MILDEIKKGEPMKSRTQKRIEAEERQEDYDLLTKQQKIAKLDKDGYRAVKERKRLNRQL